MRYRKQTACLAYFVMSLVATTTLSRSRLLADENRNRVTILSYNIHHAEGMDRKLDLDRIAAIIRDSGADVAAIQEVDKGTTRSQMVDQPAELARRSGLEHFVFGKTIDYQGGDYGNLVLSRFPIQSSRIHRFPNTAAAEQRGAVEAEIAPPGGQHFRLFATHLDFGRSSDSEFDRQEAIRMVNSRVELSGQPAVFAGDFNCTPDSRTIQTILESWKSAHPEPAFTVPVGKPKQQIDFFRPARRPLASCRGPGAR